MSRPESSAEDRATMELFGERIDRSTRCGQTSDSTAPTENPAPKQSPENTIAPQPDCESHDSVRADRSNER